jgi:DNA-binding MarR family transcriptional regulator
MAAQPPTPDAEQRIERWSALADVAPVSWAVMQLAHRQRAVAAQHLAGLGLFPGQELVLAQLWSTDGLSQKEISSRLGHDHSTIAKSVQRLERGGLVRRTRSAADGRVTLVELTDAGRALEQPVREIWLQLESRWVGLEPEEAQQFAALTRTLLDAAPK